MGGNETAPPNWLPCDGRAVSRAEYSDLFSAIGTSFGAGNGSTTFNLPNLKGKVPVGIDNAASPDTAFDTVGETGGAKTSSHAHGAATTVTVNNKTLATTGIVTTGGAVALITELTHTHTATGATTVDPAAPSVLQPYIVLGFFIRYRDDPPPSAL